MSNLWNYRNDDFLKTNIEYIMTYMMLNIGCTSLIHTKINIVWCISFNPNQVYIYIHLCGILIWFTIQFLSYIYFFVIQLHMFFLISILKMSELLRTCQVEIEFEILRILHITVNIKYHATETNRDILLWTSEKWYLRCLHIFFSYIYFYIQSEWKHLFYATRFHLIDS